MKVSMLVMASTLTLVMAHVSKGYYRLYLLPVLLLLLSSTLLLGLDLASTMVPVGPKYRPEQISDAARFHGSEI